MIPTLLIAAFMSGCALGVFLTLVAGIRIEERRVPAVRRSTCAEIAARHVMGVYVRKPTTTGDTDEAGR